jgi:copper chaperone NosL
MVLLVVKRLMMIVLFLFGCIFLAAGCQKAPVGPVNIGSDETCSYCKAPIVDIEFAAEAVARDGSLRKFDDIGCLVASTRSEGKDSLKGAYVMDYQSKTWQTADKAHFVRSDKMRTPKGSGIVAFEKASEAQDLASRYQAELLTFADLVK